MKISKKFFLHLGNAIIISMILGIIASILMGKKASMFTPLKNIFTQLIKLVFIRIYFNFYSYLFSVSIL